MLLAIKQLKGTKTDSSYSLRVTGYHGGEATTAALEVRCLRSLLNSKKAERDNAGILWPSHFHIVGAQIQGELLSIKSF